MSPSLGGVLSNPAPPHTHTLGPVCQYGCRAPGHQMGSLAKVVCGDKAACIGQWKQWKGML